VTPFIRMSRTATEDTDFLDTKILKGQELIMLYPAANRDPRKFKDPYTFDVRRDFKNARSLAFGYGHHYCIGAFLALAEADIVFQRLNARMPDWQLAGDPVWTKSSFIRGLRVPKHQNIRSLVSFEQRCRGVPDNS
jgi:cytochrome P450 family 142 subfamily A polypeptide 1